MSKNLINITVVAGLTLVSRVFGLVRDIFITNVFGVLAIASAFNTAFTLPNLFRRLLGEGALTAAFVPTLNEELKSRERVGAFQLVNQVASWLLLVSSAIVGVAMALLSLVPAMANGGSELGIRVSAVSRWIEASELAIILFPYLVFVSLAAVFSAALQTLQRFLEPALSPIWLNLAMIGSLVGATYGGWASDPGEAIRWLCAGALAGGVLQMIVPAAALVREGWRPRFDFAVSAPLRQIVRLMVPTIFGSAVYLINMAVSKVVGLSLNESAVAVLNLATRLMELPIGVFAIAVSTVVFPLISKYAAAGDLDSLASAYRKGMRLILVINVPAAVGLALLATPIIRLFFERGAFSSDDTRMVQPVLVIFALGLPFVSFVSIVLRAFYAQKDTTTPVYAAVISFGVNLALSLTLMRFWGTVGLAVASNVASATQAVFLQYQLTRKGEGLAFHYVLVDLVKITSASVVMGAVVFAGWYAWQANLPATKNFDALALALLIGAGVATYVTLLWALKIEGRNDLALVLNKVRAKYVRN